MAEFQLMYDLRWVAQAKQGDQQAFTRLYNASYNAVYHLVCPMCKSSDEVDDIIQDSYIQCYQNLYRLQDDTRFIPWMKAIARNKALDYLKKKREVLFSELESDDPDAPELEFADDRNTFVPDIQTDKMETARLLGQIMQSLPEKQKICITMFYIDNMHIEEIARMLGTSEGSVKQALMHGRKNIKEKVLALEKQGTKLYGLAPLPFFYLLVKSWLGTQFIPNAGICQAVLAISGGATAAGAAGAAVGAGSAVEAAGAGAGTFAAGAGTTAATAAGTGAAAAGAAGVGAAGAGAAGMTGAATVGGIAAAGTIIGGKLAVKAAIIVGAVILGGGGITAGAIGISHAVEEHREVVQSEAQLEESIEPEDIDISAIVSEETEILEEAPAIEEEESVAEENTADSIDSSTLAQTEDSSAPSSEDSAAAIEPAGPDHILKNAVQRENYYSSDGELLYYKEYLYFDSGYPFQELLYRMKIPFSGNPNSTYEGLWQIRVYLYDQNWNVVTTVIQGAYDNSIASFPEARTDEWKNEIDFSKTEEIRKDMFGISVSENNNWALAYRTALETFHGGEAKNLDDRPECLFFLGNNDEVPELYANTHLVYGGTKCFTSYQGQQADSFYVGCFDPIFYIPNENALFAKRAVGDYSEDIDIYKIDKGHFVRTHSGSKISEIEGNYIVSDYSWDGASVDEIQYNQYLNQEGYELAVPVESIGIMYSQMMQILDYLGNTMAYFGSSEPLNVVPDNTISENVGTGDLQSYIGCTDQVAESMISQVTCTYIYRHRSYTEFRSACEADYSIQQMPYSVNADGSIVLQPSIAGIDQPLDIPSGFSTTANTKTISDFIGGKFETITVEGDYVFYWSFAFGTDGIAEMRIGYPNSEVVGIYTGRYGYENDKLTIYFTSASYPNGKETTEEAIMMTVEFQYRCYDNHLLLEEIEGLNSIFEGEKRILYLSPAVY